VHESSEHDRLHSLRASRAKARHLVTPEGTEWMVYEFHHPTDIDSTTLVFESDSIVRRLRMFPSDWRELSDVKLAALCQER